jgi:hypothetical protein
LAAFDWGKPVSNEVASSGATRVSRAVRRT